MFCLLSSNIWWWFQDDNDINEIKEENQGNGNNDEDIKENAQSIKVFIFINTIINKSQKYFKLSKHIIIDESMLFFRGRWKWNFICLIILLNGV